MKKKLKCKSGMMCDMNLCVTLIHFKYRSTWSNVLCGVIIKILSVVFNHASKFMLYYFHFIFLFKSLYLCIMLPLSIMYVALML